MLSIIIPTLNEQHHLPTTLTHTLRAAGDWPIELIVSDCNSTDATAQVAARYRGVRFLCGASCRAGAMNRGAAIATGETLLFLHADTLLPDGYPALIARALANPRTVGGAFEFGFAPAPGADTPYNRLALALVVLINRSRYRWTRNFYGDQAVFVRKSVFQSLRGFGAAALMEDVRFCQRLKHRGHTAVIPRPVQTSPRRFLARGPLRQLAMDLLLLGIDSFDLAPAKLHAGYNALNREPLAPRVARLPRRARVVAKPADAPAPRLDPDYHTLAAATKRRLPPRVPHEAST